MTSHIHHYTLLPPPCGPVAGAFSGDPGAWLPAPARPTDHGWLVDVRADGALPAELAVQPAEVLVGDLQHPGDAQLRKVSWHALRADRLFPVLSGELELFVLAGGGCQLSLSATYRPPLSVVGDGADRLLRHRVAQACARAFVLGVAARLEPATLSA